jgi:ethanolamine utilization protein EutA
VKTVQLLGLDFGTTTSGAVIASANLVRNTVTGRMELSQVAEQFRSELVFTPYEEDRLDERRIEEHLDSWLKAGGVKQEDLFSGGALLTGLTAQADNAAGLIGLIRRRLGDALVASANDPCLESWLAFMGSCAGLSRRFTDRPIINLDIGGGTTNLDLGLNSEVLATGCLFIGARHFQFNPGSYRLVKCSRYARAILDSLQIGTEVGDELTAADVDAVLDFYLDLLENAVAGNRPAFQSEIAHLLEQVAFSPGEANDPIVTLSGGVGELVYSHIQGKPRPGTTFFGDLGIDLARRLYESSRWRTCWEEYRPESCGRATVYGLLRHSTQISGSTVFLPHPEILPLADIPILGTINDKSAEAHFRHLLDLVRRSPRGGALRVELAETDPESVRALGTRLAGMLHQFPVAHPLVLFTSHNIGKTLGHYATAWGALPVRLVVVDEIAVRNAQYAHLGELRQQVIPVSVYGLRE